MSKIEKLTHVVKLGAMPCFSIPVLEENNPNQSRVGRAMAG